MKRKLGVWYNYEFDALFIIYRHECSDLYYFEAISGFVEIGVNDEPFDNACFIGEL